MRGSSTCATPAAQKALIDSGKGSVQGNVDWVRAFDPVAEWDKMPTVPTIEVPAA